LKGGLETTGGILYTGLPCPAGFLRQPGTTAGPKKVATVTAVIVTGTRRR